MLLRLLICCLAFAPVARAADDRPNILWISCEDISPNLGCYGDLHADTPNLDRLASQGARFDHAFTPAGVCAVVRSSVITGVYAPSIGTQHMRSDSVPPPHIRCFPEYLRAAGYFCTNRSKTDYQFSPPATAWDRQGAQHDDWRERRDPDQPFFSVVNLTVSHESQIRHGDEQHAKVTEAIGEERLHDPDEVADTLPEYLPDTPSARKNWAWYHDNITYMDHLVGEVLDRLEQDGLSDDTLVVFWSDHGMGMPRGKRWIYDSGTHVPVIMRWPGKIDAGRVRKDLMSVIDLPPTMLSVAGLDVPRYMQGRVLLGRSRGEEPSYLFFHRDRMDEAYELQRGARDRRWKYIRNYEPEKPYSQHIDYMDEMPAMQEWRAAAAAGKLEGGQRNWFQVPKPIEELYDTAKDPWELENLAERPQYAARLARMRGAVERWQEEIGDMGMIPEAVLFEEMREAGEWEQTEKPELVRLGESVRIDCRTNGASIAYRIQGDGSWSDWLLYSDPVEVQRGTAMEAKACRLGFKDSPVTTGKP